MNRMDDLISRQAALKAIDNLPRSYRTKEQRAKVGGYADVAMVIEELPSAERHGRWLYDDGAMHKCSVCGELSCCTSHYCRECGAKMDE